MGTTCRGPGGDVVPWDPPCRTAGSFGDVELDYLTSLHELETASSHDLLGPLAGAHVVFAALQFPPPSSPISEPSHHACQIINRPGSNMQR